MSDEPVNRGTGKVCIVFDDALSLARLLKLDQIAFAVEMPSLEDAEFTKLSTMIVDSVVQPIEDSLPTRHDRRSNQYLERRDQRRAQTASWVSARAKGR